MALGCLAGGLGWVVLATEGRGQAVAPALFGTWCGDGVSLILGPEQIAFVLPGDVRVRYEVRGYEATADSVLVFWTDDKDRRIVTEFGHFASDLSTVEQIRGRLEPDGDWMYNNRAFTRC